MATTFHRSPEQPGSRAGDGMNALAAEIGTPRARRHAHSGALVRLAETPGVAKTLSLFR